MAKNHSTTKPLKLPYFVADSAGKYMARRALSEEEIVKAAAVILNKTVARGQSLNNPDSVKLYLKTQLRELKHEVFICIFLDNQNRVIEVEEMFRGTVNQSAVYPREIFKRALALNAVNVIFAHNHPSGVAKPSHADHRMTLKLKEGLAAFDIHMIDHFIIGDGVTYSFAEHHWLW